MYKVTILNHSFSLSLSNPLPTRPTQILTMAFPKLPNGPKLPNRPKLPDKPKPPDELKPPDKPKLPHGVRLKQPISQFADKNVFIPLFGEFTGDVWHVAAAEILSDYTRDSRQNPFNGFAFRTCITIKTSPPKEEDTDKALNKIAAPFLSLKRGKKTW